MIDDEPILIEVHEVVFGILEPADDGVTIISSEVGGMGSGGGSFSGAASDVTVTPFGSIAATDVQAALEEIVAEASTGAVDSVNGQTGVVVLDPDDLDDTSTTNKFVTAGDVTKLGNLSGTNTGDQDLSGLVPKTTTVNGHALSANVSVTASDVGLGSVDNTADTAKPVSTAQQTALNLKANLASPTFTGTVTVPSPSGSTDAASKGYVDTAVTGLLDFKGATDCSANPNYPAASKGDIYVVSVAGKIGGASGKSVDVGDAYLATADNAGGTEASVGTSWVVLEHNLNGIALTASSLAQFASTTSAQLASVLSDETGSGAAVFATSPALVTPTGIVKGDVGLGNVDNTSDANKPVSTAQAAADALAIPKLTGTAKGDLIGYSASGTPVRIAKGADGQLVTYDSTATSGVAPTTPASLNRIGSFIFAGHSWLAYGGAGGDEQSRRAEGVAGRFASMENISTTEVISLGRSGASLIDDRLMPYAGWTTLSQLLIPPANLRGAQYGGIAGAAPSAPYTTQPGGMFILYGINDNLLDLLGWARTRGIARAWPHALRGAIVDAQAGGTFDEQATRTVTDGVTTNGSTGISSATAAFTQTDVGRHVTGSGIPSDTCILQVVSATQVTLNQAATATATGVSITIDTRVAYSGTWSTITTARAQGNGYRKTVTNGDTFTFTIPADFSGGTVAIKLIGTPDIVATLNTAIASGDVAISPERVYGHVTIPTTYPTLCQIDSEQLSITAALAADTVTGTISSGTTYTKTSGSHTFAASDVGREITGTGIPANTRISAFTSTTVVTLSQTSTNAAGIVGTLPAAYTVTRGVNSTSAASHVVNSAINGVDGAKVNWSGTCTGATGNTQVSAQGVFNANIANTGTVSVVKRFTGLTAADAGTTIIGTVASIPATAGEQFVAFDCAKIEAPTPRPVVVANSAKYAYGGSWAFNGDSTIVSQNTSTASVVAEFTSTVAVADVATTFTSYGGTLGAAISSTGATSITVTAGANGPNAGDEIRVDTEDMFVSAVSGSTFTVVRGINGTTAATHSNAAVVYPRSLFSADNVHPSSYGYRVLAGLFKTTFANMTLSVQQLNEANGYYRVEPQTLRSGTYFTSRGERGRLLTTDQKLTAMSVQIHRPIVVTSLSCEVVVAGASGSVVRLGIVADNGGGFIDQLVYDAGTVATTATGIAEITGFRLNLNPGVYWLCAIPQGAPATNPTLRSLIALPEGLQPPGTGSWVGDRWGTGNLLVRGTGTFTNVTTAQTFAHGLPFTPTAAEIQAGLIINATSAIASNNFATRWVETADATNFSIRFATAPTTGQTFAWQFDGRQCAAEFAKTGWTVPSLSGAIPWVTAYASQTAGEAALVAMKIETVEPA